MAIVFCYTAKATSIYRLNILSFLLILILCHNPFYHNFEGEEEKASKEFVIGVVKYVVITAGLFYCNSDN